MCLSCGAMMFFPLILMTRVLFVVYSMARSSNSGLVTLYGYMISSPMGSKTTDPDPFLGKVE